VFPDLTALDATALGVFAVIWLVYNTLFDGRLLRPNSINAKMVDVREAWMRRLLRRDNRIVDATLIGHSIRSATFFASTTILVIAGLVGVIGSAETVHGAIVDLSVFLRTGTQALFEFKIFMLISIFVYAFFKFTWAIRQFNYFSAIIGSAPDAHELPPEGPRRLACPEAGPGAEGEGGAGAGGADGVGGSDGLPEGEGRPADGGSEGGAGGEGELARRMALILSHAVWQLNAGIRAYYFALAALGWFIHPLFFILMTAMMTTVLVRRQLASPTSRGIADHVACLARRR